MDIVDFKTTENDAKDFLFRIRTIITGSLISSEAKDFFLINIDNWFGDRWLGFSGKVLGALGVAMKNLTIPLCQHQKGIGHGIYHLLINHGG